MISVGGRDKTRPETGRHEVLQSKGFKAQTSKVARHKAESGPASQRDFDKNPIKSIVWNYSKLQKSSFFSAIRAPARPAGHSVATHRRVTRIGRPPSGWVVSFCTGHGLVASTVSKRKRDSSTASAITASCMAKAAPMQTRWPAPNGRYW